MGAKFIMLKPICKKKLLGFLSRFVQFRFKTQNLMLISKFESVEKVAKISILLMCLKIPFCINFRSRRLHFLTKRSKSLYHMCCAYCAVIFLFPVQFKIGWNDSTGQQILWIYIPITPKCCVHFVYFFFIQFFMQLSLKYFVIWIDWVFFQNKLTKTAAGIRIRDFFGPVNLGLGELGSGSVTVLFGWTF
jgi:hypothetical protein